MQPGVGPHPQISILIPLRGSSSRTPGPDPCTGSHSPGPRFLPLQGSLHLHTLGGPVPSYKLRSPQPAARSLPFPAPVRVASPRSRAPQPGFPPSRSPNRPGSWGRRTRTPGDRASHLQPKMVAPAHVPSSGHGPSASVPKPPLPPPGSFSTAARVCPTHSHPHWASSTPITAAPRPTGRFARPSPRKDVSNANAATFPSPAPSTHLGGCSLAPAPRSLPKR